MLTRVVAAALALVAAAAAAPLASDAALPARRIVSLIPSLTEDLFAVGAGPQVVGVSAYSTDPPAARRLPVVSSATSVDTERIVALHPDLVLGIPSQETMIADLRRAGIHTVLVADDSLQDLFDDLSMVGTLSGHEREASAVIARLHARTRALLARVDPRRRRPSIFVVLGDAPIFTVGDRSYVARLIALAGGRNAARIPRAYAAYSAEALVAQQPDALLVDHDVPLTAALRRPPWSALNAVRAGRVYVVPEGNPLFRPGPRYNDALAWLVQTIALIPA